MTAIDWQAEISAAAARIEGHVMRTPVATRHGFGLAHPVAMKFEHMQHTGSFKLRGAFNSMLSTPPPAAGYVAASGGNHGAAVAFAARALGYRARIFVPELAGPAKIELIKAAGAELTVVPGAYADAAKLAAECAAETGAAQIHPFDAVPTVAGQGTVIREWEEQGLDADTVLIAVGGGGLIAGAMAWLNGRRKVVAVEPELAPTLNHALRDGPDTAVSVGGAAANALGARQIGRICYDLAMAQDTLSLTVDEAAIAAAHRMLWQELRQYVEPAAAVALAALTSGAYRPAEGERVAVLICGANPAASPFSA